MTSRFVALVALMMLAAGLRLGLAWASEATPIPASVLAEDRFHLPPPELATLDDDTPESLEVLRQRIADVLRREGVPGVGIALVDRNGIRWAGGVGVMDIETNAPVQADTVFRVASITKSIVGLGALRLHAQGRLDLDAPLRDTMPELQIDNPWDHELPVTLAHALEHTAGFDDMRFNEWFTADEAEAPARALQRNPRSRRVRWRPGSRMSYSNVGYSIAALAIERATGERFDTWLAAEILRPMGIERADFRRTDHLRARLATGYRGLKAPAPFRPIAHRGAGALLASPTDLGRLVHFLLVRGEGFPPIVSAAAFDRIERAATSSFPTTDAQYGLGNYGDVGHPVRGRGHDGGLPGFLSSYRYFPSLGVGYVMLLNATHSARAYLEIRALIFSWLVRGRVLPDPPAPPDPPPPGERPAGFFAFANPRHELFGFLERAVLGWQAESRAEDELSLVPLLGAPVPLVPTADGGWRHPLESGTSVRFGRDTDGRPAMVAGWAYAEGASRAAAMLQLRLLALTTWALHLAPFYAIFLLVLQRIRRRPLASAAIAVWPALASLQLPATALLLQQAAAHDALGEAGVWTIGVCVATVLFALFSARALAAALGASWSSDRESWLVRLVPTITSVLAFGLTLWLGAHGVIGLRTWAW